MKALARSALAFALLALMQAANAEFVFRHSAPVLFKAADPSHEVVWSLESATLPEATVGESYSYDFSDLINSSENLDGLGWSAGAPLLPSWLSLNGSGVASGTPTSEGEQSFEVVATHAEEGTRRATYTIVVNGVTIEVTEMDVGGEHACAITTKSEVVCWGAGSSGALGNGSFLDSRTPVKVLGLSGVQSLAVGGAHTCAVAGTGVWCWGFNGSGQLGNDSTANSAVPVQVNLPSAGAAVKAGGNHSCAMGSGKAYCWGQNTKGQLGDGTVTNRSIPVAVQGIGPVLRLGAGDNHSCAIDRFNGAMCWGDNMVGQLGDGNRNAGSLLPVTVPGLSTFSGSFTLTVGGNHACLQASEGTFCWGNNSYGQLGNGTTATASPAVEVIGISGIVGLEAGGSHTCAITTGGSVSCWGFNNRGQLGNGTTTNSTTPVSAGLVGATSLAGGGNSSCAVRDGGALCWGDNFRAQLGDGTKTNRTSPVPVQLNP